MSINRYLVCDGPDCENGVLVPDQLGTRDMLPRGWFGFVIGVEGSQDMHFCSAACLADYASDAATRPAEGGMLAEDTEGADMLGEQFADVLRSIGTTIVDVKE